MQEVRALTAAEFARVSERLRHPRPGGRIEASQRFGVDLSLLIEHLGMTPEERVRRMQAAAEAAESVRGAVRRARR